MILYLYKIKAAHLLLKIINGGITVEFSKSELVEAKRQIDSTLHKLRETVKTLEAKEIPNRYKSQITLARRRIDAFEISVFLIERELMKLDEES